MTNYPPPTYGPYSSPSDSDFSEIQELRVNDDIDLLSTALGLLHLAAHQLGEATAAGGHARSGSTPDADRMRSLGALATGNLATADQILDLYIARAGEEGTLEAALGLLSLVDTLDTTAASIRASDYSEARKHQATALSNVAIDCTRLGRLIITRHIEAEGTPTDQRSRALRETPPPAGGPRNLLGGIYDVTPEKE